MALAARAAPVRLLPHRPSPTPHPKVLKQGLGRHAGSSLAVRTKDADSFGALLSEKPAAPAPAKRDGWEGFGRDVGSVEKEGEEEEVQSEPASWDVLNRIGVELDSDKSYTALVYGTSAVVAIWISSVVVSALDSVPLVPQVMEVVGLGFTIWFISRYLIFKENRDELITRVTSIKTSASASRCEAHNSGQQRVLDRDGGGCSMTLSTGTATMKRTRRSSTTMMTTSTLTGIRGSAMPRPASARSRTGRSCVNALDGFPCSFPFLHFWPVTVFVQACVQG